MRRSAVWAAGLLASAVLLALALQRWSASSARAPQSAAAPTLDTAKAAPEPAERELAAAGQAITTAAEPAKSGASRLIELANSDDPGLVEAALNRIPSVYAARSTKKPGPDAELEQVLAKHVRSERATTVLAALKAARVPLMARERGELITRAIAELAAPEQSAARRYAALEALNLLRPDRRASEVLSAFERALDAKAPELVSLALLALSQSGRSIEGLDQTDRARLAGRVVGLLGHYDPGVRGRALLVLAEVPALVELAARLAAAQRALADREAYVRAQAADLSARCREPLAIHALIEHVADMSAARYELRGFTTLDGASGTLVHEVPGRTRVAEAAVFAMRSLSALLEDVPPLSITLGDRDRSEALVLQNAELARSWYRAQRERIPRIPAR